jgi:hypothetical protein
LQQIFTRKARSKPGEFHTSIDWELLLAS